MEKCKNCNHEIRRDEEFRIDIHTSSAPLDGRNCKVKDCSCTRPKFKE